MASQALKRKRYTSTIHPMYVKTQQRCAFA